jgi:hypothetical protein
MKGNGWFSRGRANDSRNSSVNDDSNDASDDDDDDGSGVDACHVSVSSYH